LKAESGWQNPAEKLNSHLNNPQQATFNVAAKANASVLV
jgi:hypothetical protein